MARRKSKFMEDDDDSSDSDNSNGDAAEDDFDPNDEDAAADRELFKNPYARQKKKPRYDEDLDEGDWGGSKNNNKGKGKKTNYTKGQSFVAAGSSSSTQTSKPIDNLSTTYSIESESANTEEVAMELDSDIDSSDSSEGEGDVDEDLPEEESLASIPGLTQPKQQELPSFAPRGIGMRGIGGGGIGSRSGIGGGGGGGIGSRGIGSKGNNSTSSSSLSKPLLFASATSVSAMPLGGFSLITTNQPISGSASPMTEAATPRAGLGAVIGSRAGIGGGGGIGSQPRQSLADSIRSRLAASNVVPDSPTESNDTDSASNSNAPSPSASVDTNEPPRERRSFLPTAKPTVTPTIGKISVKEQQHFRALQAGGDLGFKLLEKMGWTSGTGLGASGQGIVTPIGEGQKMRKKGAGIASGERSAGSIAEAKRMKGEDPDEPEKPSARKTPKAAVPKAVRDVWQQPKKKTPKSKAEYKTYEQIVADAGGEAEGVGLLVDLSGNALSASALSSLPAFGAGSADPTRLPELRHNLSLLASTTFASLSSLAREGKSVDERRLYLDHEESRIRKAVESQEHSIRRLEAIQKSVTKISTIERETMELLLAVESSGVELDPEMFLKPFADEFDELYGNFSKEYEDMRLDEVVVGAIAPIVRRLLANWDPLTSPSYVVSSLKRWKKHFLIDKDVITTDGNDIDVYGAAHYSNGGSSAKASDRLMTPYESMLWTIWLPRVRSAINNSWSPSDPLAAVNILTSWFPILPLFLRDNTLDQLIMPKVLKAITDWSPSSVKRGGASLHTIVFPWLEHAGERMEQILDEAKRKVRAWLKAWKASDGVPVGMDLWQEAFPSSDWDTLVLKHVLPQLGTTLRETFAVNPRQQDLKPLEDVMAWAPLIRSTMLSQLLESGFFPKWLNALYVWLTSEKPNFDQVAQWYSYWKSYFPDDVLALSGVSRGFRKGLDLMNQAMALGDDAKYRLKRPDTAPNISLTSSSNKSRISHTTTSSITAPSETSFKSIVEEIASASNLLFLSTNQVNEKGHAIYRVSQNANGGGGVRVYLDGDVVWIRESELEWKPVGIEEMVKRALK